MKKTIVALGAMVLMSVLASSAEYILKFSHVVSPDTPKGKAAIYFKKRLEKLSNGAIKVEIYPNSQLYKDNVVLEAIKNDSVQMACPSLAKFTKLVPQLALFDLPFLFKDIDHVHRVQDGKVGKKLKDMVYEKGFIAIDFWDNAFKQLTDSKRPLIKPQDAKGLKFRIMNSKVLKEQFKAIGAIPQVMPFLAVYTALEEDIIDGQENTNSNIYTKKFYKVQKYMTITNHGYLGYLVVISKKFWDSLPPRLKVLVNRAMREATDKEREWALELDKNQFKKIQEYAKTTKKLQITKLNSDQIKVWRKAMEKIYPEFYSPDSIGKELIDMAKSER